VILLVLTLKSTYEIAPGCFGKEFRGSVVYINVVHTLQHVKGQLRSQATLKEGNISGIILQNSFYDVAFHIVSLWQQVTSHRCLSDHDCKLWARLSKPQPLQL